ncbi:MAG: aminoglycoside phosphotransferase family protein [Odoribacteraceae bacterium]|jgi:aminoglycoside phosphotransferase (APT) family kinase protein|nr:aminoglycoside phosphotransferase family protein [Odoribacteraceae bacterium]
MEKDRARKIYDAFAASGKFVSAIPMEDNDDKYHIIADEEAEYILHCIRPGVFSNIPEMIRNKEMVSGHIRNKLIKQNIRDITRRYITYFHTYRRQPYYKDHEGNYWTLVLFIKGTRTHERATSPQVAGAIGAGLGEFEQRTQDFDPRLLKESVPRYQNVTRWKSRLQEAIARADPARREACSTCVEQLRPFDGPMSAWQEALEEGQLPTRVTHNAFNAGSVLFDWNDHPLCVLNLDMVMPGALHYDFGDAVRSVCDPGEGGFDAELFRAFTDGFMQQAGRLLARKERETLPLAGELMPYLQATRRLVEFLEHGTTAALQQARAHVRFLHAIGGAREFTRKCIDAG